MSKHTLLFVRRLFSRQQPAVTNIQVIKAGVGGALAIATLVLLGYITDSPFLMAPFGATCVLLFTLPNSPLSQPINVIAGHIISITVGITLNYFLPFDWWSIGLAVGLSISVMAALRVTHPPAGADPIVAFISSPGWEYILFPVAVGSMVLVITAWAFHKLPPTTLYPIPTE